MSKSQTRPSSERAATGIRGLDRILRGGFPRERTCLVYGAAGTGKTTLGFQFLLEGAQAGEKVLYITLLQNRSEIEDIAESHGWSLDNVNILELPSEVRDGEATKQTVFSPADVELNEAVDAIIAGIKEHKPQRLVLDSVSELSVLVNSRYQLRRQVLRLKELLSATKCTALFTAGDLEEKLISLKTLVHGVVSLRMYSPPYGMAQRRLEILKMRGMNYSSGQHDCRIYTGGLQVFPRLELEPAVPTRERQVVSSGVKGLDSLVGGGLEAGTSCLITGTTGAGKSTVASLYVNSATEAQNYSVVFCFDECRETFLRRSARLEIPIADNIDRGYIDLRQVDVGQMSSGEFMHAIAGSVEDKGARVVVIDSLTGYLNAMLHESMVVAQLHELLSYLNSRGVLSIMTLATHGIYGNDETEIDASYLADAVLLARHFEAGGSLRRCISVVKKRYGGHEKTIREFDLSPGSILVGPPLRNFSGVLSGIPRFEGEGHRLLDREA